MKSQWVRRGLKIVGIATLAAVIVSVVVMSLWNWLVPEVFGGRTITFWQALGLLVLSRILFGGWRGRSGPHLHWRQRMRERWAQMTPEEREQFRQGLRERCGRQQRPTIEPQGAPE
jgi:Ca2+/H+ antiporter, TMEM165/GDT1 family